MLSALWFWTGWVLKERGARGQCAHLPMARGQKDALPGPQDPDPEKQPGGVWDRVPGAWNFVGKWAGSPKLGAGPRLMDPQVNCNTECAPDERLLPLESTCDSSPSLALPAASPTGLCPALSRLQLLPGLLQWPPPCSLGIHLALQFSLQQPEGAWSRCSCAPKSQWVPSHFE